MSDTGHETRVWYWLSGAFDPAQITARTGCKPQRVAHAGDLVTAHSSHRHKEAGWWAEPDISRLINVEAQLDALVELLKPHWDAFVELGHEYQAGVTVVVYSSGAQGPEVTIRPDVAAAIGQLNATLGFDLYFMGEPGD